MDHIDNPKERDFEVDLEKGGMVCENDSRKSPDSGVKKQAKSLPDKVCDQFSDVSIEGDEQKVGSCCNSPNSTSGVSSKNVNASAINDNKPKEGKSAEKERRKNSLSNKKSPKPPRPPRGPSLDAADQKLVREITELAMLKRARIDRMRALKKTKAAKASSSNGNLFALVLTVLFGLVILFQGIPPRAASRSFQGSPRATGRTVDGLISVRSVGNPYASEPNVAYSDNQL